MNISFTRIIKSIILILLSLALIAVILYFGLYPKGFISANTVRWIENRPGINLGQYSSVYAKLDKSWALSHKAETDGFSIEIAIKPVNHTTTGFDFILSMHSGNDKDQLLIGQWRSYIIIMNNNDYRGLRKIPKISVNMGKDELHEIFLTITTDIKGTTVYINGQLIKTNPYLVLKIPQSDKTILTLGNSVYANHTWKGRIYGLAYYNHLLLKEDAASHFEKWLAMKTFSGLMEAVHKKAGLSLLYSFNEKQGNIVKERITGKYNLKIPERIEALRKNILFPDFSGIELNYSTIEDIILNFLGFILPGLVLSVTIRGFRKMSGKKIIFITVAFCFLLSLAIEIIQAWIPSRSSSIIDLVLNTLGAFSGSFGYFLFLNRKSLKKI